MRAKNINWRKISASIFILGAVFVLLSLQTKAASQSDAIGVRVMPNTNHDSIESWYAKQGYKGSPQSLIVDGYEAIRDGRTVFVNAANLDSVGKKIYTNIYLISYNQESEVKTLDILGQLVSHWKFNNNITGSGHCSISSIHCQADTDCPSDYTCSNSNSSSSDHASFNKGKCVLKSDKVCNIDSDCPVNLYCDSLKARSIRDVKRLGELNQINSAIESFKATSGSYPSLQAGTYILGSSLSVWPSWKDTLWNQLGLSQLLVDPINTLGYCDGYDAITCWDNKTNAFVNSNLFLPSGSYSFVYKAAKNGINYALCSVFETKDLGYDTLDKKISSNACSVSDNYAGTNSNTAPFIVSSSTSGETGKEFNGYIKVKDAEGDLVSWKIASLFSQDSAHASDVSSWSAAPVLRDTGDANQKKLYAAKAGNTGSYDMDVTLTDSRGAATTTRIIIKITAANKPIIEAEDVTYFVDPINPLKYTFNVEGTNSKPTYTITPVNSTYPQINAAVVSALSTASVTSIGLNKNKVDFSVLIPTSVKITQDIVVPFNIKATANGISSTQTVNFNFKIEKPYLNFQCENMARLGQAYQIDGSLCLLGSTKNGNHSISYKVVSGPAGLAIDSSHYSDGSTYLGSDNILAATPSEVKIAATNEYGATTEKTFNLKVNTFCGDGKKQKPNTEGRGGLYNNGVEECDGYDGVWTSSTTVSPSSAIQYACTSGLNIKSPYPILDNNNCVFKAADQGGGYCGDGYCQNKIVNVAGEVQDMENCSNCSDDCGKCLCTPNCGTSVCGSDGCGGSCGDCGSGDVCNAGSCCPTKANIQVCADNAHKTYFNGDLVGSGNDWSNVEKFDTTIQTGKNVMAIKGMDWGGIWGFSATLNQGSCKSMTTDDLANWKCINANSISSNDWVNTDFDDSNWQGAMVTGTKGVRSGNYLEYQQIWSPDANYASSTVYCRYTFSTFDKVDKSCVASCSGKCGGSDGCGGFCPDTCSSPNTCGGAGVPNVCGAEAQFTCTPNCSGKCGGPDGCGSICDNTCDFQQYCVSPKYTFCKVIRTSGTTQAAQ